MGDHQFTTIKTHPIYQGAIFTVRQDQVCMPTGTVATRDIIEHSGSVAIVALNDQDHVALVYQYRHAIGHRLYELPAGILDVADESPLQAAQRELHEETGLHAQQWALLLDLDTSPGYSNESVRIFLARHLQAHPRPPGCDEEADLTVHWYPLDQAITMIFSGEILNAATVGGLLAAQAVIHHKGRLRPVDTFWRDRPNPRSHQ